MVWIEFMGPSGVGKSFWYNKIVEKFPELDPPKLLFDRINKSSLHLKAPNKIKILSEISKLRYKQLYFRKLYIEYFRNTIEQEKEFKYGTKEAEIVNIFFEGISFSLTDPITRIKLCEMYAQKLKQHCIYDFILKEKDVFLSEDGIIHTNWGLGINRNDFNKIPLPNIILLFTGSEDYIFNNRKKREGGGAQTWVEATKNYEDLTEYVSSYHKLYNKNINFLKKSGIKIVEINVEDEVIEEKIFAEISLLLKA